jgi:hypothetical protein
MSKRRRKRPQQPDQDAEVEERPPTTLSPEPDPRFIQELIEAAGQKPKIENGVFLTLRMSLLERAIKKQLLEGSVPARRVHLDATRAVFELSRDDAIRLLRQYGRGENFIADQLERDPQHSWEVYFHKRRIIAEAVTYRSYPFRISSAASGVRRVEQQSPEGRSDQNA